MRKLACILVVLVLLFNSMGYFIVFRSVQFSIKSEIRMKIKSDLADSELTIIRIADSDGQHKDQIEWFEESEFRYRGSMYDVVRTQRQNECTVYFCINDIQEEQLFANLDQLVKQQTESTPLSGKSNQALVKNIVREALPDNSGSENGQPEIISLVFFGKTNLSLAASFIEIPSPPPEA